MIFFVILTTNGIVHDVHGFELYNDAEIHAVEIAKSYGIEAIDYDEIVEILNRENTGKEILIESGPYSDAESGKTYSKYPYELNGEYVTAKILAKELHHMGYDAPADPQELHRWVRENQNNFDEEDIAPVPGLKYRMMLDYRGGEKEKTVYAQDESDAVDCACDYMDHLEMWVVDDE